MFRFSIRELMLAMLAAAMGMAWVSEHTRLNAARADAIEARREAREQKKLTDKATYEAEEWKNGLIQLVRAGQAEEVDCEDVAIPICRP
jgi:hypothetical protein